MASSEASTSASQRAADESDLDPAEFLQSIKALSEERERVDAERMRKLEEEIERGRQERAARRAERAKSISPTKASAAPTRAPVSSTQSQTVTSPPPITPPAQSPSTMDESSSQPAVEEVPEFKGFRGGSKGRGGQSATQSPAQTQESSTSSTTPARSASSLARSGTLSWQQRPSSRGAGSRPTSMVSTDSAPKVASTSADETEPSRDQIAASLGARDPSWFRQTADRGLGNAAYRKSKDESTTGENFASGRRGLPGMSREASTELVTATSPPPSETMASDTTSRTGSIRGSTISSSKFSTNHTSTSSKPDLKALIAEDAGQEKASPMSESTSSTADGEQSGLSRTLTMSSSQARLANTTDRPASPTKGMGGFVQSAMMKRSESQTKRWSAQPGSSISRQNSAASARNGFNGLQGSHSMPKLEPTPGSRESSKEADSRPTSSSSNLPDLASKARDDKDVFVKPALPSHSRSKSVASSVDDGYSEPSSPSKRWSPNKSTWLESAITKPDSPKPAPAARNSQPSWMADIARAKAQRGSADSTPKPAEDESSRPGSPTKAPFGQGMLKRSESRDLGTPRTGTPTIPGGTGSRSASPTKTSFEETSSKKLVTKETSSESAPVLRSSVIPGGLEKPLSSAEVASKPITASSSRDINTEQPITTDEKGSKEAEVPASPPKKVETPSMTSKPPSTSSSLRGKPDTPPKPQTDFRSNLRSRGTSEAKQQDAPEFLSKFGQLKKTTTQNYVAPDVLKDNILRGKSDLTKTGGPVKTQRRDELKESLLAKKEQWKKEKEEGIVHERKVSNPPQTPQKPEALAKRELLGRAESIKGAASPEKPRDATPEALARHKSLKENPKEDTTLPALQKQKSEPMEPSTAPAAVQPKQSSETSKLAARFNPGLAGILARGPPSTSNAGSRSQSPANAEVTRAPMMSPPSEALPAGEQLQDMRKGRAKGPKRRKGGARDAEASTPAEPEPEEQDAAAPVAVEKPVEVVKVDENVEVAFKLKSRAPPPGSAASVMMASLQKTPSNEPKPSTPAKSPSISSFKQPEVSSPQPKPSTPAKSPSISSLKQPEVSTSQPTERSVAVAPAATPQDPPKTEVPEFKGFGSTKKSTPAMRQFEDDKENAGEGSPSVKSAASVWGRQSPPKKSQPPAQIQLPSEKDEEAAMRSAGLLASSPSRPGSSNGLGIKSDGVNGDASGSSTPSAGPPRPTKPSRAVSGQLSEASPNKGSQHQSLSQIEQLLAALFDTVPRSTAPLSIDTHATISTTPHQERVFRTVRKLVYVAGPDGALKQLPPQDEYTFFEEDVYICVHAYSIVDNPKKTEIFVWVGAESSNPAVDQAQTHAKKLAKENGNAYVHIVRQDLEAPGFLQALGGILVTRRGSRDRASKQHMLRGRKHLGQIVFDEVDFEVENLCSGFAYLISFPVTLQETMTYLWKGSCCSTEEISGGRLAAVGSTDDINVIDVDDRAEFASFLKIFGPGTSKSSIPKPSSLWQQKALAPNKFSTRLFRIQLAEAKTGIFSSMFRRPSWGSKSPARQREEVKVEAIDISPFAQADLEVDCIYVLDAYAELYVLVGPMFPSQPEAVRNVLFSQTLLFASEYAVLATSEEDRPAVPKASILVSGVPKDLKMLFRHWDEGTGLWGTGGLMAGAQQDSEVEILDLNDVLGFVCR